MLRRRDHHRAFVSLRVSTALLTTIGGGGGVDGGRQVRLWNLGMEFKLLARSEGSLIDDESRYDKKLNIPAQWYQEYNTVFLST